MLMNYQSALIKPYFDVVGFRGGLAGPSRDVLV